MLACETELATATGDAVSPAVPMPAIVAAITELATAIGEARNIKPISAPTTLETTATDDAVKGALPEPDTEAA
ncbi:hypothetical protein ES703_119575 [subsurface metagenome]